MGIGDYSGGVYTPGGGYVDTQFNIRYTDLPQTLAVAAIPEPSTGVLLAAGLGVLSVVRKRGLRAF